MRSTAPPSIPITSAGDTAPSRTRSLRRRSRGVKHLVTFHHDPGHDDAALDRMIEEARGKLRLPFELIPGTEGTSFELGNSSTDRHPRAGGVRN